MKMAIDKETVQLAMQNALVSRGKNRGQLKAQCPPMGTPEAAAWQALVAKANPYKLGIGHLLFMSAEHREIFDTVEALIKNLDVRRLDRDRMALEVLGAW
jgi:hypothetical protein